MNIQPRLLTPAERRHLRACLRPVRSSWVRRIGYARLPRELTGNEGLRGLGIVLIETREHQLYAVLAKRQTYSAMCRRGVSVGRAAGRLFRAAAPARSGHA